ncbi:MAG: hypothetical protein N838_00280 [Thiohalocapsa sp. PB-PSB1]|nr:MAG: hypothetical protein N838_00280 [Thiohalocapsa sp. PB-PSB1]
MKVGGGDAGLQAGKRDATARLWAAGTSFITIFRNGDQS